MLVSSRKLAVITGASTGIGFELAKQCAQHGFVLVIAADEPDINDAAEALTRRRPGGGRRGRPRDARGY
jgi:uncharacterized protein